MVKTTEISITIKASFDSNTTILYYNTKIPPSSNTYAHTHTHPHITYIHEHTERQTYTLHTHTNPHIYTEKNTYTHTNTNKYRQTDTNTNKQTDTQTYTHVQTYNMYLPQIGRSSKDTCKKKENIHITHTWHKESLPMYI